MLFQSFILMANINSTPHNLFSVPDLSSETNRDALSGQGAASRVLLHSYHSPIEAHELMAVANALVNAGGKGIYATDVAMEGTTECHFNDEENRERGWRWKEAAYAAMPSGKSPIR
jgi:hypothetical protein